MIPLLFGLVFLGWTIYSYTQIDLNLTLFSHPVYQTFQQQLIQIGYFNRPLSTGIFIFLILVSFTLYFILLKKTLDTRISDKKIFLIIAMCIGILFFSYSAFSHDLFNYMFDARIVTTYHANPYTTIALNFPNDLWTRFMHWTHRTYPYGPLWLLITLPFSYLGFSKFILTLYLFKMLFVLTYLGNSLLIFKILKKINSTKALFGLVFYALNPLIYIESILSPHLDSVMLFFLLFGIYLLLIKRNPFSSLISIFLSGLVKFVTFPVIIPFLVFWIFEKSISKKMDLFILVNLSVIMVSLIVPIIQREPYAWYFILVIGVGSLLISFNWVYILLYGLSLGLLLRYIPFLYTGEYTQNGYFWMNIFLTTSIAVSIVYLLLLKLSLRIAKNYQIATKK